MKIIIPMVEDIESTFKKQYYNETELYKPIIYIKTVDTTDGVLLYNTLTKELILITKKEYDRLSDGTLKDYNHALYIFMVTHWYMVPEYFNEKTMVYLLHNAFRPRIYLDKYIEFYTILTTTDCNARCFYCYEKGTKKIVMEEQTAHDVAKYIIDHTDPKGSVRILWFGGEPLYNMKAIDIIIEDLIAAGVKYYTTIISNGYLFDEDIVEKASNKWKMYDAQITIDGTKDTYNKTKSYIYKDDKNPFEKILRNIKLLIDAKIHVNVRLNISEKNVDEMYSVVNILNEMIEDKDYIMVYTAPLFENIENNLLVRTDDQRKSIYEKSFEIGDYIRECGLSNTSTFRKQISYDVIHCMVDNPRSCLINPEGNIGSCEHHIDDDFFGSIYNPKQVDFNNVKSWRFNNQIVDECNTCYYLPLCRRHNRCIIENICDESTRKEYNIKLEFILKNTLAEFKRNNPGVIEEFVENHKND